MDYFGGHEAKSADAIDLVRQLVELGEPDQAVEVLREYAASGSYDDRLPAVAAELRDRETLHRLAATDDRAAAHWAKLIIEDEGVEAAEAALAALPWATAPRATHRLSLARALLLTGRIEDSLRVATEVLDAQPSGRFVFGARCLITDLHVAREDLDALQQLGDAGDERAEQALYRILGDRGDLNTLTRHVERGRHRARREVVNIYERRGDLEALRTLFRRGYSEAEQPLALLCWERGAHEHVAEIAERGGSTARSLLVDAASSEGDRESLTKYAACGYDGANSSLNRLLATQEDTAALRERADHGDHHAVAILAGVFVERGDIGGMRELVAAFPYHWQPPWQFADLLAAQGRTTELRSVLHQIIISGRVPPNERVAAQRLADAADINGLRDFLRSGAGQHSGGGAGPEMLEWVVLAVTSGVLGNAAYAGLNSAIKKLWGGMQKRRNGSSVSGADVAEAVSAGPAWHTAREALEAACLAIHQHCTKIEVAVPDFTQASFEVQHSRGRWVFIFREPTLQGGRRFQVSVPPRQEGSSHSVVVMQVPSRAAERSLSPYL
jgi:tetratricopeptide (TPR) repeat protein